MEKVRRPEFIDYKEAFDTFTQWRSELNDCAQKMPESFSSMFAAIKFMAVNENAIAMDVLAYFYKTGVKDLLPENYMRFIKWQVLAAARGNEFAIEKVQFLIGYACEEIMNSPDYELIQEKNDIDDYNVLYVLGKAICKILARDYLDAFPVDLAGEEDDYQPYSKEAFVTLRKKIDECVPKVIKFLKS